MIQRTLAALILAAALTVGSASAQFGDDSPQAQNVLVLVTADERFSELIEAYPDYNYYIEDNDETWFVELFVEDEDIWLGEAVVDAETLEIVDMEIGEGDPEALEITPELQQVIDTISADDRLAPVLANFPEYQVEVFDEGEFAVVAFFAGDDDEEDFFLGEAFIHKETRDIEGIMVAQLLSAEQIAERTPQIIAIAESDPAVAAILAEIGTTAPSVEYHAFEGTWGVYYEDGFRFYEILVGPPEEEESISGELVVLHVESYSEFDTTELEQMERDNAIALAFEADAFQTMDLPEDWFTRTTPLGDGIYGVDFVTEDGTLILQVVVDLPANRIIETRSDA